MASDFGDAAGRTGIDKKVFWPSVLVVVGLTVPILVAPDAAKVVISAVMSFVTGNFGWLYLWFAIAVFGGLVWLACSRHGRIKFGDRHTRPDFSTTSWIAMIFTAGIGGGIMLWGVIEWAYYYQEPPFGAEPRSVEAARWAMAYPLFHWGFTAWAIYCLPALALSYTYYVRKRPTLRLSEACRGVLGSRVDGWLGRVIDALFIFGLIGAAGTSLGLEVPIISAGLTHLTSLPAGLGMDVLITVAWTALFGASVYLGLHKGLKVLANVNMWLAGALGVFVLVVGPTVFILDGFTDSVGTLVQNFVQMSLSMDPVGGSGFEESWTVFYWAWWVAYAPFVGLFTAKISKGRTVRELIVAMCVAGSLGCWIAFAILGGTAMRLELDGVVPITQILAGDGQAAAVVAAVSALPLGTLALIVYLVLLVVFLATTLDSSAYTMAAVATRQLRPQDEPARWHRVLWAVALAAVSISLMAVGGLEPLQTLSIITALPLVFVLAIVALSFLRWIREHPVEAASPTGISEWDLLDEDGPAPDGAREPAPDPDGRQHSPWPDRRPV
ncbi:BCCT family transporter [Pseudonocardia nigra]|uniref:BCCT family transporter n=1 Tax=Pseudonocardia nigra TaxID=1921578 RepID=UPI001C5DDB04|nr:BCCT family transporter [Pseudonocardia nigra]